MRVDILKQLNQQRAQGRPAVVVTVLNTRGSTPRKAGSQMLVLEDGSIRGTIGGGLAEAQAMAEAGKAFQSKASSVHRMTMTASVAALDGMACGGDMEVFVQYVDRSAEANHLH